MPRDLPRGAALPPSRANPKMLTTLYSNMQVPTRKGFTGSIGRSPGATFIMINAKMIPCTKEAFENGRDTCVANFAVIAAHSEGMQRAPFKYNDNRKGGARPPTKPLTAAAADGNMQFWSYQRRGTDKGERCDDVTWTLGPGATIKTFFRVEDLEKVLPAGLAAIPEMSLCEVTLVPKSSEPCVEGWGLSVRSVKLSRLSLYSYIDRLSAFQSTREEAKRAMLALADKEQPMRRMFDHENACYVPAGVSERAFTEYVPPEGARSGLVKLWQVSDTDPGCVDIPEAVAVRYTNSQTVEEAMRLIEVAIACKAFTLFVFTSEFRGKSSGLSECYGVPVLDTAKLFAPVTPENLVYADDESACFKALANPKQFTNDDNDDLFIRFDKQVTQTTPPDDAAVTTEDLVLTAQSPDCCESAYPVRFVLSTSNIVLWAGHFNTSTAKLLTGGPAGSICPQRRKWDSVHQ